MEELAFAIFKVLLSVTGSVILILILISIMATIITQGERKKKKKELKLKLDNIVEECMNELREEIKKNEDK